MSKATKSRIAGAMLELWRPSEHAGEPVGCLATTYTFDPELFADQCLGRFLEIDSEPDREDLPYLLQRETRLGGVYTGVMVDPTHAGVQHSLRWDVLPVRIRGAKQHAKLSVLAWTHLVRIIVSSANLSVPGYRTNQEVAASIDLRPGEADRALLAEALTFLRGLLAFVPGAGGGLPEVQRAEVFLRQVETLTAGWRAAKRDATVRRQLVCTLPGRGPQEPARSSLDEAMDACRRRGRAPSEVWVASPFFDENKGTYRALTRLLDRMARGGQTLVGVCAPAVRDGDADSAPRLLHWWRPRTDTARSSPSRRFRSSMPTRTSATGTRR